MVVFSPSSHHQVRATTTDWIFNVFPQPILYMLPSPLRGQPVLHLKISTRDQQGAGSHSASTLIHSQQDHHPQSPRPPYNPRNVEDHVLMILVCFWSICSELCAWLWLFSIQEDLSRLKYSDYESNGEQWLRIRRHWRARGSAEEHEEVLKVRDAHGRRRCERASHRPTNTCCTRISEHHAFRCLTRHCSAQIFFFGSFGHKDPYKIYDWPLFHSSTAAAAIYKEEEGNNASTSSWIDNRCHYNCKLQEISPRTPNVMISHVSKSHSQPLACLTCPAQICISLCPWEHRLTHQLNRGEPLVSSTTAVAPYPIDDATIVLSYLKVAIL